MKNKTNYQKTFSRLTASEDLIQEVLQMDQKKVYRISKRAAGLAVAASLALTATGAAYAATDGDLSQFLEKVTLIINGKEVSADIHLVTDENGQQSLRIPGENNSELCITASPDAALSPDAQYTIDIDTSDLSKDTAKLPFRLDAEGDHLYLVEADGSRTDITKAAASKEGYAYTWKDADGVLHQAVAMGTPAEHFITLGEAYQVDTSAAFSSETPAK